VVYHTLDYGIEIACELEFIAHKPAQPVLKAQTQIVTQVV